MALKKSYEDCYGVTHTEAYWRVLGMNIDKSISKLRCVLVIYHDEATRADPDKKPLPEPLAFELDDIPEVDEEGNDVKVLPDFTATMAELDGTEVGTSARMYAIAKLLPELEGAVDC